MKPIQNARRGRALLAVLALLTASVAFAADGEEKLQDAKSALERLVEVRKTTSREKQEWALGRELLQERIAVVQRQIDGLRAEIAEADVGSLDLEEKRAELEARDAELKSASGEVGDALQVLEERTLALLPRLPAAIRERVRPLSQRVPRGETQMSVSERALNVIGILNQVNKFHREVTVTSEVLTLADGTTAEVAALYLGVAQGYYASASGERAGVGRPGPGGWTWVSADEHAAEIALAIAIHDNEEAAAFVRLPLSLD